MVLGQSVTVTYAQRDRYEWVLGTVFKPDCSQVNLNQVASGAAWYNEPTNATSTSGNAKLMKQPAPPKGLWATATVAAWLHRNGVEAKVPASCPNGEAASD